METYIGLLRGVNVGGKNRMSMVDLGELLGKLGAERPRTYIQSGNFVVRLAGDPAPFVQALEAGIVDRFGFASPVVLRAAAEWPAVLPASPFPDDGTLYVGFLRDAPDPARVAALNPDRSPGDAFAIRGRELYLRLASGAGRTKLTADWFDRQLATVSTWRNTRTVRALGALLGGSTGSTVPSGR